MDTSVLVVILKLLQNDFGVHVLWESEMSRSFKLAAGADLADTILPAEFHRGSASAYATMRDFVTSLLVMPEK